MRHIRYTICCSRAYTTRVDTAIAASMPPPDTRQSRGEANPPSADSRSRRQAIVIDVSHRKTAASMAGIPKRGKRDSSTVVRHLDLAPFLSLASSILLQLQQIRHTASFYPRRPSWRTGVAPKASSPSMATRKPCVTNCHARLYSVEMTGLGPATPWMQTRCSPN